MKLILALLLVSAVSLRAEEDVLIDTLKGQLQDLLEEGIESLGSSVDESILKEDGTPRNAIFNVILGVINKKLANLTEIDVEQLGNSSMALFVEDATILGVNATEVTIDSPTFGYSIKNLTVKIPELNVLATHYVLNQLNLGILILDGEGDLRIDLYDFEIMTALDLAYNYSNKDQPFRVAYFNAVTIGLNDSVLALSNLGNSGPAVSDLLNGIASKVLPQLVSAVNNEVQKFLEDVVGTNDCNDTNLELICNVIGAVVNKLYKSAVP